MGAVAPFNIGLWLSLAVEHFSWKNSPGRNSACVSLPSKGRLISSICADAQIQDQTSIRCNIIRANLNTLEALLHHFE